MNIKEFIIQYFLQKDNNNQLDRENILAFNYMESCFFTSVDFIEMIANFEEQFGIVFQEEDLQSKNFSTIGGLVDVVLSLVTEMTSGKSVLMN